jgi:MFS family permease
VTDTQPARAATSPQRLIILVALAMFISYVDRGNLATAAPLIQAELKLSPEQLGVLLSSFFLTYVLAMIPAGWLAERYGAYRVMAGGLLIWSVATLGSGLVGSFVALLLLRLLLGLGESVSFPSMSKLIASGVPQERLGFANGMAAFGYLIGPAVGTFVGGWLIAQLGWRPVFLIFGVMSLLWLLPWSRVVVHEPRLAEGQAAGPSFAQILRQRSLWGTSLGLFSMNYAYYLILTWLPTYLVSARGFSLTSMAAVAAGAYLLNAFGALASGWVTDRWVRAGHSANVIYKTIMGSYHVLGILCMIGIFSLPELGSIACLYFFQLIVGISAPGAFSISQTFAGPSASARWVGVQNMWGNVAGFLAPIATGLIVGATGSYQYAFLLAAAVNVLGLIGWVLMLPKIEPIQWRK